MKTLLVIASLLSTLSIAHAAPVKSQAECDSLRDAGKNLVLVLEEDAAERDEAISDLKSVEEKLNELTSFLGDEAFEYTFQKLTLENRINFLGEKILNQEMKLLGTHAVLRSSCSN